MRLNVGITLPHTSIPASCRRDHDTVRGATGTTFCLHCTSSLLIDALQRGQGSGAVGDSSRRASGATASAPLQSSASLLSQAFGALKRLATTLLPLPSGHPTQPQAPVTIGVKNPAQQYSVEVDSQTQQVLLQHFHLFFVLGLRAVVQVDQQSTASDPATEGSGPRISGGGSLLDSLQVVTVQYLEHWIEHIYPLTLAGPPAGTVVNSTLQSPVGAPDGVTRVLKELHHQLAQCLARGVDARARGGCPSDLRLTNTQQQTMHLHSFTRLQALLVRHPLLCWDVLSAAPSPNQAGGSLPLLTGSHRPQSQSVENQQQGLLAVLLEAVQRMSGASDGGTPQWNTTTSGHRSSILQLIILCVELLHEHQATHVRLYMRCVGTLREFNALSLCANMLRQDSEQASVFEKENALRLIVSLLCRTTACREGLLDRQQQFQGIPNTVQQQRAAPDANWKPAQEPGGSTTAELLRAVTPLLLQANAEISVAALEVTNVLVRFLAGETTVEQGALQQVFQQNALIEVLVESVSHFGRESTGGSSSSSLAMRQSNNSRTTGGTTNPKQVARQQIEAVFRLLLLLVETVPTAFDSIAVRDLIVEKACHALSTSRRLTAGGTGTTNSSASTSAGVLGAKNSQLLLELLTKILALPPTGATVGNERMQTTDSTVTSCLKLIQLARTLDFCSGLRLIEATCLSAKSIFFPGLSVMDTQQPRHSQDGGVGRLYYPLIRQQHTTGGGEQCRALEGEIVDYLENEITAELSAQLVKSIDFVSSVCAIVTAVGVLPCRGFLLDSLLPFYWRGVIEETVFSSGWPLSLHFQIAVLCVQLLFLDRRSDCPLSEGLLVVVASDEGSTWRRMVHGGAMQTVFRVGSHFLHLHTDEPASPLCCDRELHGGGGEGRYRHTHELTISLLNDLLLTLLGALGRKGFVLPVQGGEPLAIDASLEQRKGIFATVLGLEEVPAATLEGYLVHILSTAPSSATQRRNTGSGTLHHPHHEGSSLPFSFPDDDEEEDYRHPYGREKEVEEANEQELLNNAARLGFAFDCLHVFGETAMLGTLHLPAPQCLDDVERCLSHGIQQDYSSASDVRKVLLELLSQCAVVHQPLLSSARSVFDLSTSGRQGGVRSLLCDWLRVTNLLLHTSLDDDWCESGVHHFGAPHHNIPPPGESDERYRFTDSVDEERTATLTTEPDADGLFGTATAYHGHDHNRPSWNTEGQSQEVGNGNLSLLVSFNIPLAAVDAVAKAGHTSIAASSDATHHHKDHKQHGFSCLTPSVVTWMADYPSWMSIVGEWIRGALFSSSSSSSEGGDSPISSTSTTALALVATLAKKQPDSLSSLLRYLDVGDNRVLDLLEELLRRSTGMAVNTRAESSRASTSTKGKQFPSIILSEVRHLLLAKYQCFTAGQQEKALKLLHLSLFAVFTMSFSVPTDEESFQARTGGISSVGVDLLYARTALGKITEFAKGMKSVNDPTAELTLGAVTHSFGIMAVLLRRRSHVQVLSLCNAEILHTIQQVSLYCSAACFPSPPSAPTSKGNDLDSSSPTSFGNFCCFAQILNFLTAAVDIIGRLEEVTTKEGTKEVRWRFDCALWKQLIHFVADPFRVILPCLEAATLSFLQVALLQLLDRFPVLELLLVDSEDDDLVRVSANSDTDTGVPGEEEGGDKEHFAVELLESLTALWVRSTAESPTVSTVGVAPRQHSGTLVIAYVTGVIQKMIQLLPAALGCPLLYAAFVSYFYQQETKKSQSTSDSTELLVKTLHSVAMVNFLSFLLQYADTTRDKGTSIRGNISTHVSATSRWWTTPQFLSTVNEYVSSIEPPRHELERTAVLHLAQVLRQFSWCPSLHLVEDFYLARLGSHQQKQSDRLCQQLVPGHSSSTGESYDVVNCDALLDDGTAATLPVVPVLLSATAARNYNNTQTQTTQTQRFQRQTQTSTCDTTCTTATSPLVHQEQYVRGMVGHQIVQGSATATAYMLLTKPSSMLVAVGGEQILPH